MSPLRRSAAAQHEQDEEDPRYQYQHQQQHSEEKEKESLEDLSLKQHQAGEKQQQQQQQQQQHWDHSEHDNDEEQQQQQQQHPQRRYGNNGAEMLSLPHNQSTVNNIYYNNDNSESSFRSRSRCYSAGSILGTAKHPFPCFTNEQEEATAQAARAAAPATIEPRRMEPPTGDISLAPAMVVPVTNGDESQAMQDTEPLLSTMTTMHQKEEEAAAAVNEPIPHKRTEKSSNCTSPNPFTTSTGAAVNDDPQHHHEERDNDNKAKIIPDRRCDEGQYHSFHTDIDDEAEWLSSFFRNINDSKEWQQQQQQQQQQQRYYHHQQQATQPSVTWRDPQVLNDYKNRNDDDDDKTVVMRTTATSWTVDPTGGATALTRQPVPQPLQSSHSSSSSSLWTSSSSSSFVKFKAHKRSSSSLRKQRRNRDHRSKHYYHQDHHYHHHLHHHPKQHPCEASPSSAYEYNASWVPPLYYPESSHNDTPSSQPYPHPPPHNGYCYHNMIQMEPFSCSPQQQHQSNIPLPVITNSPSLEGLPVPSGAIIWLRDDTIDTATPAVRDETEGNTYHPQKDHAPVIWKDFRVIYNVQRMPYSHAHAVVQDWMSILQEQIRRYGQSTSPPPPPQQQQSTGVDPAIATVPTVRIMSPFIVPSSTSNQQQQHIMPYNQHYHEEYQHHQQSHNGDSFSIPDGYAGYHHYNNYSNYY